MIKQGELMPSEQKQADSTKLEAQAIGLYRQYKYFLPDAVKKFFRQLADFNQWENLKREL